MSQTTRRLGPKHVQYNWLGLDALSLVGPIWGSAVGYLLFQRFSKGLAVEFSSCFSSVLLDLDLYD